MVGPARRVLDCVEHLAQDGGQGVPGLDLTSLRILLALGVVQEGRPRQLQLEVVEPAQLQLPAKDGNGGYRHLTDRAQVRDADVLRLRRVFQDVVHDLPLRFCKLLILLQHQRHDVLTHCHAPFLSFAASRSGEAQYTCRLSVGARSA